MTRRWMVIVVAVVCAAVALASGQARTPERFGGSFTDAPRPEQQHLVAGWDANPDNRITGKSLAPTEAYDTMSPSTRTTFEAVTHALYHEAHRGRRSRSDGRRLSTGQVVHGEIKDNRLLRPVPDYVLLEPDALYGLYRSQEFKRTGKARTSHRLPDELSAAGGALFHAGPRTGCLADV